MVFRRLPAFKKRVDELEQRIAELEEKLAAWQRSADGSLTRHAVRAACLIAASLPAGRRSTAAGAVVPPPPGPEFFSRFDFHMSVESLSPPKDTPAEQADERFSWDTHFGGSFDVVDLVVCAAPARASTSKPSRAARSGRSTPTRGTTRSGRSCSARVGKQ